MSENPGGRQAADRFTYLYSATVLGVAFLLLVYVGQYMEMVEIQIDISHYQSEMRDHEEKIERLLVRRAELARLERLEFAAQERLGLILPGQANVHYIPVLDLGEDSEEGEGSEVLVLSRDADPGELPAGGGQAFAGIPTGPPALATRGQLDLREEGEVP